MLFEKIKHNFATEKIDTTDGIKVIFEKGWLHIRKSGTEPIIRLYAEAETEDMAKKLCNEVFQLIVDS